MELLDSCFLRDVPGSTILTVLAFFTDSDRLVGALRLREL